MRCVVLEATRATAADAPSCSPTRTSWGVRLTLNRPDKLNALSGELVTALDAAVDAAEPGPRRPGDRARGRGRAFCCRLRPDARRPGARIDGPRRAGATLLAADVAATLRCSTRPSRSSPRSTATRSRAGSSSRWPATWSSRPRARRLGEPEIRYGSAPVTLLMPYLIGQKRTRELLLTGDLIDAVEAERIGLINRVVPLDRLAAEVDALADRLARTPPEVMAPTKRMLNRAMDAAGFRLAVEAGLDLGRDRQRRGHPGAARVGRDRPARRAQGGARLARSPVRRAAGRERPGTVRRIRRLTPAGGA